MKSHLLTLCAALLLLPTTALAAPADKTVAAPHNDEGAAVREHEGVRELIFDTEDTVDGEVLSPNGVQVGGRIAKDHANMIGIRGQFINQLIWMSNDI